MIVKNQQFPLWLSKILKQENTGKNCIVLAIWLEKVSEKMILGSDILEKIRFWINF